MDARADPVAALNEISHRRPDAPALRAGRALCLAGAAVGAVGLIGWFTDTPGMATWMPGFPPMNANTALALLLLGAAGALRARQDAAPLCKLLSLPLAAVVLALGVEALVEYALATDLRVSELILRTESAPHARRPSPPSALAITLLALALMLTDFRAGARARPSEWLILAAATTAFASLMGLLLGARPLHWPSHPSIVGVALPSAVGLLLLCAGLLLERPSAGVMRMATSRGPGGLLLRRFGLTAVVAPVLLGLVIMWAAGAVGVDDITVVAAILAAAMTIVVLMLLASTAVSLDRAHGDLESNRAHTRSLLDQAPEGVFVADLDGRRKRLDRLAREAVDRLAESEERFRLAIENAPIGMALVAIDGRFVRVNRVLCEIVGYSADELRGLTFQAITHPDDLQPDLAFADRLCSGEIPRFQVEKRYVRKDGSIVDVMLSVSILRSRSGEPLCYISQIEDISERKRLARDLQLSESKATGILAISADAIISIDEQQRITSFNEGAEKIFGYRKAEVLGTPLERLIPERFRAAHRQHVVGFAHGRQIARKAGEGGKMLVGLRKDGREFPADATISKLEVGGQQILTVALRDVTEEKRLQNEQRLLAEVGALLATNLEYDQTVTRFAELMVRQLAEVCIVDIVAENGIHRIRAISRGPGKPPAHDARLLSPRDAKALRPLGTVLETKKPALVADAAERSAVWDRNVRSKSLMAVPLIARDALVGMVTFISLVPSRRYGPSDLRLAEELAYRAALSIENARLYRAAERAIHARDDVLGVVAHDLRNPLGTVLVHAAMLRRVGLDAEHAARKAADRIELAATHMSRLIDDLLDVTRVEAGRLTVHRDRLNTAELVCHALDSHLALSAASSLELRLDSAPDLPDVWADRDRLLQVLENLIGNALKFTAAGGAVTLGAAPHAADVLFWVADTGVGVSADDLPHVFDRFWQARNGARHSAGLGLPIVKGIVEAHDGSVWVESTPGRGTTFFFTIPTAASVAASLPRPEPHSARP